MAHSVRDQSVVLLLPDGERRLISAGEKSPGVYDLELLKVLPQRIELVATHPSVSDRKLKLWFKPGSPKGRLAASSPDSSEIPQGPAPVQLKTVDNPG